MHKIIEDAIAREVDRLAQYDTAGFERELNALIEKHHLGAIRTRLQRVKLDGTVEDGDLYVHAVASSIVSAYRGTRKDHHATKIAESIVSFHREQTKPKPPTA
jgi:hypothetical protein